jgi:hypothetical protein
MTLISTDFLVPVDVLRGEIEQSVTSTKILSYPMLAAIQKEDAYQTEIAWPVNVAGSSTTSRTVSQNPSASNQDNVKEAKLPIGDNVISHTFTVKRNEATQAARTAPQALRNLFRYHIVTGTESILRRINQLCYVGTGSAGDDGVIGLSKVVDNLVTGTPDTNLYASIDGVTYSNWASYVSKAGSNRALSTDLLLDVEANMANKGGNFTALFMNPLLVAKYKKLFEGRLAVDQVNGVADLGYSGVSYSGRPIIQDADSPTNSIYFVDAREVSLATFDQSISTAQMSLPTENVKVQGLNLMISQLPVANPHAITFELSVQAQLKVRDRRAVGGLLKITQ